MGTHILHRARPALLLAILCGGCEQAASPPPPAAAKQADAVVEPAAAAAIVPAQREQESEDEMASKPMPAGAEIDLRNRLGDESSPYLLQHQHNPVHWFAWGPEAFEAARALDRPIFLSVGYSTCYWCHVMERESFESDAVAAVMNEHFVCIKLDREERPDVDDIYMTAVQIFQQGRGGWPMSVFLEPEQLRPFYGGTYYTPAQFTSVMQQLATAWSQQRDVVIEQATRVADAVRQSQAEQLVAGTLDPAHVEEAVSRLLVAVDEVHGGFGGAPKFPMPATLDLLIGTAWDLEPARRAVTHTLDRMAMGGMYDQVGGGFHRYSTDERWLVPHFEKMLYDNGQLASTYAEAHRLSGDAFYAEVVRETLDYVRREMTAPGGAFLSAQDAEVNHREGQNYLWTDDQVRDVLTAAGMAGEVDFALDVYGLRGGTNFQDPHHPEEPPSNVLHLADRPAAVAEAMSIDPGAFDERLRRINAALLASRATRDQPLTDDKIITSWNGLMIAGMADGGRVLEEPQYTEAAAAAAAWILEEMRGPGGGLLRTARGGAAKIDGFLDDYAGMIHGLLALERARKDGRFLEAAVALAAAAKARFHDAEHGGYFDTRAEQSDLFVRTRSAHDGALPSGNSLMASNLVELHRLTGERRYLDEARATLESLAGVIERQPTGAPLAVLALHRLLEAEGATATAAAPQEPKREPSSVATAPPTAPTIGGAGGMMSRYGGGSDEPVTVSTGTRMVDLQPDGSATLEVTITVANGWHVNAHEPGISYLIPLKIELVGADGVTATVEYPKGEQFQGPEGSMLVHHGSVTIPVRLKRAGSAAGKPRLMLTYQACDDRVCLEPKTVRVPAAVVLR